MNLSLAIARRYFISKKSQRVINIISIISVIGVIVGTAALIIVLSVFNGFQDLIVRLYNSFDAEYRITPAEGKMFESKTLSLDQIKKIPGVSVVCPVIEESALINYREKQFIVTLKGVDESFGKLTGIDSMIVDGTFKLTSADTNYAVVGGGVGYNLQLNIYDIFSQLEIYAPRRTASGLSHPQEAFNREYISASGVFSVQQEYDGKYVIIPLRLAQELFEYENHLTAIEVGVKPGADKSLIREQLAAITGNRFIIKDRFQQHELLYKIMKSEKWAVFMILSFILLIATFNVISSLTMLIIDKKEDISIFYAMGANTSFIRKVFIYEGLMITFAGALIGLMIGFLVCFLQQTFGLIQISGAGSFVIDAYPVKMLPLDFLYVLLVVSLIGLIASFYPVSKLIKKDTEHLDF